MAYQGSCHCGQVRIEVEGTIDGATSCNCSMCQRKGILMWFVPKSQLTLVTPEANAATYTFNKHVIRHRFCSTCGIHVYGEAPDPKGNLFAAINIRCLEGVEPDKVPLKHFDGRAL